MFHHKLIDSSLSELKCDHALFQQNLAENVTMNTVSVCFVRLVTCLGCVLPPVPMPDRTGSSHNAMLLFLSNVKMLKLSKNANFFNHNTITSLHMPYQIHVGVNLYTIVYRITHFTSRGSICWQ